MSKTPPELEPFVCALAFGMGLFALFTFAVIVYHWST